MSSFDDVNFKVEKDCAEEQKWEIVPEELSPTLKTIQMLPMHPFSCLSKAYWISDFKLIPPYIL